MPLSTILSVLRGVDPDALTQTQREAMVDLGVLMMYADGHISDEEETTLIKRLEGFRWESQTPREHYLHNAIARVRDLDDTSRKAWLTDVSQRLGNEQVRRRAIETCEQIAESDHSVAEAESRLIKELHEAFGV